MGVKNMKTEEKAFEIYKQLIYAFNTDTGYRNLVFELTKKKYGGQRACLTVYGYEVFSLC